MYSSSSSKFHSVNSIFYCCRMARLLDLLPSPWPDLLVILSSLGNKQTDPLARAEAWWLQVTESAHSPGWVSWSDLIDTLGLKQPVIKNNKLIL